MWARPHHRFRRRQTKGLHPSSRLWRQSREEVASNKQEERPGRDWSVCPKLSSCADLLRLVRDALEKESWALVVVCSGDLCHHEAVSNVWIARTATLMGGGAKFDFGGKGDPLAFRECFAAKFELLVGP
jgi:hypothetical protein